ncbi:MAG TPA: hydroxylamine reductase [Firmicutes bacterium]|nr:hydroxylamine reductase [Bacillota bacterium]
MYCNQCSQTVGGIACTKVGVCGKDANVQGLQENLIYALKGISAYAYNARELGYSDTEIDAFLAEGLYSTLTNVDFSLESLFELNLKAGFINLKAMELLKKAHVETFGLNEPQKVFTGTVKGPGILVTGHDFKALYELLEQIKGTNIKVYTHSEMLPAHGYPVLKSYENLVGNLGKAWWDQKQLFEEFPGVILGTSNCVLLPKDSYKDRFYTVGIPGLPGVKKVEGYNFKPLIEHALKLPELEDTEGSYLTTGFSDSNVLPLADKILSLVKEGKIGHFLLVGGCDAPGKSRNFYRDLVEKAPENTLILTLACGKFRFNDLELGEIDGIPRMLDLGQCNDAISAINIAVALAEALNVTVNDLPLTIALSWMEQKAVSILMTLLALDIKNIRLGPVLPAWLTPDLFNILSERYGLRALSLDADKEWADILGQSK